MSALAHPLTWQAPRPLWRGTTPFAAAPQILRFASDDFMEQMLHTLAEEPARISDRIAVPETWRSPPTAIDTLDPIIRLPLPAPVKEAKRRRLFKARPVAPPALPPAATPLKLYQPAHQRYYLVTGTLACALPGLPERAVAGGHETVHFVLRRLLPATDATPTTGNAPAPPPVEFAYVKEGDDARWQRVAATANANDAAVLAPGEELLPLFPLQHHDEDAKPRTLWAGLVPVARREEYLGKAVSRTVVALAEGQRATLAPVPPAAPGPSKMARTTQLRMAVMEPWKALVRAATKAASEFAVNGDTDEKTEQRATRITNYNLQYQHQSWLLLLDLANWLSLYLPRVHAALTSNDRNSLSANEQPVLDWLNATNANALAGTMGATPMATNLRDALRRIGGFASGLEDAAVFYPAANSVGSGWPTFHFPLAGLKPPTATDPPTTEPDLKKKPAVVDGPFNILPAGSLPTTDFDASGPIVSPSDAAGSNPAADRLDKVTALLATALDQNDPKEREAPPLPHAMKVRDVMIATAGDQGRFVLRMVHVNEDCGPLHPPTLSARSQEFRLASFFDPEAPVRPITITLPSDTSPAGLRKHGRGTAFVMSDLLCGQVQRAKGLGFVDLVLQVLPWPFHKDIDTGNGGGCKGGNGLEIGMICSLSIPIITLCALILLIIIVTLLDFIFRWMPWFIACFPIPKLKGKPA